MGAFRGKRRRMLSILAALLAVIWVGQAVAGLLFREPADAEKLRVWIPLSLLAYTTWHWLKTACRTPIEPFEWTPAERELLATAPIERGYLVGYRLITIVGASLLKAACFSLVMLPDLRIWLTGFLGMLLALLFVDLVRMVLEVIAYGMTRRAFLCFRALALASAAVAGGMALFHAIRLPGSEQPIAVALELGQRFLLGLMELRTTWLVSAVESPFRVFSELILASTVSLRLVGLTVAALALVGGAAKLLIWLDRVCLRRRSAHEQKRFAELSAESSPSITTETRPTGRLRVPPALYGAGAIAWRQMLGLIHYRTTVLISLIIPAVLSCLTLLTPHTGLSLMIQLVGGLVFYTFLLLPTALKFDFRRDIDRIGPIKSLPISPTAVTIGELAVPVIVSTLFQLVVLLIAMVARPYHPAWLLLSLLVLLPVNVLIVSFENLMFMWFPYRLNQEGVTVFLRSILTFTAKGIVFAMGLAMVLLWAVLSKRLATALFPHSAWVGPSLVFAAGTWLATTLLATTVTMFLVRAFHRFDPSQDAPAIS